MESGSKDLSIEHLAGHRAVLWPGPPHPATPGSALSASDLASGRAEVHAHPEHMVLAELPEPCLECAALVIHLTPFTSTANATHTMKSFLNRRARFGHFFTKAFCTHLRQILF